MYTHTHTCVCDWPYRQTYQSIYLPTPVYSHPTRSYRHQSKGKVDRKRLSGNQGSFVEKEAPKLSVEGNGRSGRRLRVRGSPVRSRKPQVPE